MREECFVLQPVRVSPANSRPVDDLFFAAPVYILSVFSASLPEIIDKGGCFFDRNCTKQRVVLRACMCSRPFSLRVVLECSDFSA